MKKCPIEKQRKNKMKWHIIFFIGFCICFGASARAGEKTSPLNIENIKILDLKTARLIALKNNYSLKAALTRVIQAKERVVQARSAYWPGIDTSLSGNRTWLSDNAIRLPGRIENSISTFKSGISATYLLFDGFAREFRNSAAEFGKKESLEAEMDARRLILGAVSGAFYNALLARENIKIAKADMDFNKRLKREALARYKAGTGALSDLLNFRIQVNSAQSELIFAKKEYKSALYGLFALMGIKDSRHLLSTELAGLEDEAPHEMILPDHKQLISYAHAHRPDILAAEYSVKMAGSGIGEAKAGFWPVVSLSGGLFGEREDDIRFEKGDYGGSLYMTFTFNLFEGGRTMAKVREARAKEREAVNFLENLKTEITSQVLKTLEALKFAQTELKLQRENQKLVRRNRELVEKEYNAGQASFVRLNEAQKDLVKASGRLALSLVSLRNSWQNLKIATGEILEEFNN